MRILISAILILGCIIPNAAATESDNNTLLLAISMNIFDATNEMIATRSRYAVSCDFCGKEELGKALTPNYLNYIDLALMEYSKKTPSDEHRQFVKDPENKLQIQRVVLMFIVVNQAGFTDALSLLGDKKESYCRFVISKTVDILEELQ